MNNNNWKNRDLAHTNADVKPQGVIFTISDRDVRNFYENYFANLDGFRTVRIFGEKGGRAGNKLQAFAFFDANSSLINRSGGPKNISPLFKGKLDAPVKASGELQNKFKGLAPNGEVRISIKGSKPQQMACIELDPFALLGLMLDVNPASEVIVISKVELIDRQAKALRITVSKQYRSIVSDRDINDVYNEIYNNQLSKH